MPDNEFSAALEQAIEAAVSDVNTTVPGTIVSFDASRNRAVVRPSLPKRLADGTELAAPDIHEVPVQWPTASGGVLFTMPIRPGDGVTLHFAQRALDEWLTGDATAPQDPRRYDLTDAVAVPGLRAAMPAVDPDNIVLAMEGTTITVEPGGTVRIKTSHVIVEAQDVRVEAQRLRAAVAVTEFSGTVTVEGELIAKQNVRVDGDVKGGAVSLRQHAHVGVRGGAETSGIPVNGGGGI